MIQEIVNEQLKKLPSSLLITGIVVSCIFSGFLMSHTVKDLVDNVQETKADVKILLINQASQNQLILEHERRLNLIEKELIELRKSK